MLPKCAAKAIKIWVKEQNKNQKFTIGIVSVIHTFERDLKWKPHVHIMITEGDKGNKTE